MESAAGSAETNRKLYSGIILLAALLLQRRSGWKVWVFWARSHKHKDQAEAPALCEILASPC